MIRCIDLELEMVLADPTSVLDVAGNANRRHRLRLLQQQLAASPAVDAAQKRQFGAGLQRLEQQAAANADGTAAGATAMEVQLAAAERRMLRDNPPSGAVRTVAVGEWQQRMLATQVRVAHSQTLDFTHKEGLLARLVRAKPEQWAQQDGLLARRESAKQEQPTPADGLLARLASVVPARKEVAAEATVVPTNATAKAARAAVKHDDKPAETRRIEQQESDSALSLRAKQPATAPDDGGDMHATAAPDEDGSTTHTKRDDRTYDWSSPPSSSVAVDGVSPVPSRVAVGQKGADRAAVVLRTRLSEATDELTLLHAKLGAARATNSAAATTLLEQTVALEREIKRLGEQISAGIPKNGPGFGSSPEALPESKRGRSSIERGELWGASTGGEGDAPEQGLLVVSEEASMHTVNFSLEQTLQTSPSSQHQHGESNLAFADIEVGANRETASKRKRALLRERLQHKKEQQQTGKSFVTHRTSATDDGPPLNATPRSDDAAGAATPSVLGNPITFAQYVRSEQHDPEGTLGRRRSSGGGQSRRRLSVGEALRGNLFGR
jgi:hypothetical protein